MKFAFALIALAATPLFSGCQGQTPPVTGSAAASEPRKDAGDENHFVRLTDQQLRDAQIELAPVGPARIREFLPLYGTITPNAIGVRQATARFPGIIRGVSKNLGDRVAQGETLAVIESNESLQRYNIASPLSGVVTTRDANLGEQTGERVLFTVADLSSVWVEVSLFPRDVGKVKTGQTVRVHAANGASADGRVIWVAPFGTSSNQTLTARALLDNTDGRWAPGLYVTAEVALSETEVPRAVRNDALQTVDERTVVFVRGTDGFVPRPVQLGRADAEYSEAITGLNEGETYATRNSFILKAEFGKGDVAEH